MEMASRETSVIMKASKGVNMERSETQKGESERWTSKQKLFFCGEWKLVTVTGWYHLNSILICYYYCVLT